MVVITCEGGCGMYTDQFQTFTRRDDQGRILPVRLCLAICAPIERRRRAKAKLGLFLGSHPVGEGYAGFPAGLEDDPA
jgi:hypothetical protein